MLSSSTPSPLVPPNILLDVLRLVQHKRILSLAVSCLLEREAMFWKTLLTVLRVANFSTLQMKTGGSSETFIPIYQTTGFTSQNRALFTVTAVSASKLILQCTFPLFNILLA